MFQELETVEARYTELNALLSDPEIIMDRERYRLIAREHSDLSQIVDSYQNYNRIHNEIEQNKELLQEDDEEIKELAKSEINLLQQKLSEAEKQLRILLIPKDPNDDKSIFLEIRAGTGGEEASLFAADLFRMYCKYAEINKWKVDIMDRNLTGIGGVKEIISLIEGRGVYSKLKYESGVHRVQRVPSTESQGRLHTSAVTVAILPEADDIEVDINPNDLKIDVFRSSGPGGQSVNTTDSAVRITHLPTDLVVTCQDEKSQHKNKAKALRVLKARLLDKISEEQRSEISENRKNQVGSGDRSERIRTYNFPQGRVTDHRIGFTLYKIDRIMEGDLDDIIDALTAHYQAEALQSRQ
ncbi:MAG: peptide chain release factor 1 [Thermodesulfobacteriota bacterium]|nr:peptide chain release factor 1 [Thermodesulfobacteriota bacterium]